MIQYSERPYNLSEIKLMKQRKLSFWNFLEDFGKIWMLVIFVCILPLKAYEKFIAKVSSETQIIFLIPVIILSIVLPIFLIKKNGNFNINKEINNEIKFGKAQILTVKTNKVIKRDETYDLGSGFYLEISENETLYLQGQYYDELEYEKKFPNTHFEISSTKVSQIDFLNVIFFGEYINPVKTIKAFSEKDYKSQNVHYDGEILKMPIENII